MISPVKAPIKDPMYVNGVMSRSWVRYFNDADTLAEEGTYINQTFRLVTSSTTLTTYSYMVMCNSATPITVTLPSANTMINKNFIIYNAGVGEVTIACTGTETLQGASSFTMLQYESLPVLSDGTNWYAY